jgi:hypothetical protein
MIWRWAWFYAIYDAVTNVLMYQLLVRITEGYQVDNSDRMILAYGIFRFAVIIGIGHALRYVLSGKTNLEQV